MVSKPISGDAAEQRLKTEVMQLPPRDRRRIKGIPEVWAGKMAGARSDAEDANGQQRDPHDAVPNELEEYHLARQIKLPSQVPASAGGLNKTSKTTLSLRRTYDLRCRTPRTPSNPI